MAIHASCTVLGVIGGKGGVGKSVFAANLASALMLELRTQVLLVDGDSRSVGDQNVIMGLKPNKTIKELSQFTGSINPQNLNNIVSMHSSGLAYLGAVRGPEEVLNVSPDHASKIIENLSRIFKFIVIDLGSDLSPLQQTFLVDCTALVLVTTPEVLVVTQTQRLVNDLLSLTFPRDMFQLVINKSSPQGLSAQAISNQLQLPMMGLVPQDDLACFGSLQKGLPFVLSQPKSPLAQSYFDFVRRLTGGVIQRLKSVQR
ncbi:MAG: CpaE family protein, partial [bacterium]